MAEILVSVVAETLIGKLISTESNEISLVWGVKDGIKRLQKTLTSIHAVLTDAEKQQVEKETVKLWLDNLKDMVYEAEDILEEFEYRAHKQEIQVRKQDKVRNFFSRSNPLGFNHKMAHKIKLLNQKLDQVSEDKEKFSFNKSESTPRRNRETHSLVDVSMFVGREKEKSEIIDLLLDNSCNQQIYCVILIVAMGGVGKTALAGIIYGDDVVKQHFEKRLWVCVSEDSSRKQVFNQLLDSGKKEKYTSLDVMVNDLKEKLQGNRYLIVLDDMWTDDHSEWDDMLNDLLLLGSRGSKVIITSRCNEVVSPMSSIYRYSLAGLSEDDCWTMLDKIAFGPEGAGKTTELTEIGKNIARKCKGVPLTIKVLGRLMYSKKSEHEWQSIENNEIWNLPAGVTKVMKVLKLSYDHLEPHLKQCFRYCSLFQKDCIIKRKNLIRMWMAEGFLGHSRHSMEIETLGNEYFSSLLSKSFFQEEKKNEFGIIKSCKMHDLIHDLAQSVAKSESSMIIDNTIGEEDICRLRRVSFASHESHEVSQLPAPLAKVKKLRALISTKSEFISNSYGMQIFTNFNYLRVLDLSRGSITELPPSISKLIHLRYLNLSDSQLKALPSSFTALYNLQTLNIKRCNYLKDFPKDMRKLTKLRYLLSGGYPMLKNAGLFTSLVCLPVFVVGNKSQQGFGIQELRDLNLLSGKLKICNLENISNGVDAEQGGLKEKQHILRLELHWSTTRDPGVHDDFEVLQGLQPHRNLKRLQVYQYVSSKFPTWMMSPQRFLPNLVHLILTDCVKCEYLPPLGLLPFLKVLTIDGLDGVKNIGSEFYGSDNAYVSSFPCLEFLTLTNMSDLVEWQDQVSSPSASSSFSSFPRLERFIIMGCRKLTHMPNRFPSLKTLYIKSCNGEPIRSLVESNRSSLTSIQVDSCNEFVSLPLGFFRGNNVLSRLEIWLCENFAGFTPDVALPDRVNSSNSLKELGFLNCGPLNSCLDLRGFNSLRMLLILFLKSQECISGLEYIISKKSGIEYLPKLETLEIGSFSGDLEPFPFPAASIGEGGGGTAVGNYFPSLCELTLRGGGKLKCLPDQIQNITSLQCLRIYVFNSLVALPEWLGNLTSLRELVIFNCENLKYLPSQEKMLRLTSLRKLSIYGCQVLVDRCKGGEEAYKISPEIEVNY